MTDDALHQLAVIGAARRAMGERLMPTQIATRTTPSGLLVRKWRDEYGHEWETILKSPPNCPTCREARWAREREERDRRDVLARNRRRASEEAGIAHNFGGRHLICLYCCESRASDAKTLTEACASMFSAKTLRGFHEMKR